MNASHFLQTTSGALAASTGSTAASIEKIAISFMLLAAATVLLFFPPAQYSFYPQCPIHQYLGILCPGCGTTRAFAALLRGHLSEALQLNALTTICLPLALVWRLSSRKRMHFSQPSPAVLCVMLAIVAAFTFIRNL